MGAGGDFFSEETAGRSGMKFCMATINERALTWPVMLPRVISGLRFGDFPEAGQYLFAVQVQPVQSLGLLLDELLLHGGAVLEHVGADTGFGFSVGGGVGVEADGFGGTTVGHGAREDQAGKGYFLIGEEGGH